MRIPRIGSKPDPMLAAALRAALAVCACAIWTGCASVELPTLEESAASINRSEARIDSAETVLRGARGMPSVSRELTMRVRTAFFNKILGALAGTRSDDARITFLPTRPLMKEDKSVLGIRYTNHLDIDSGSLVMNLVRLQVESARAGRIEAALRIEGRGKIRASGRYTGLPASAEPEIDLLLDEKIAFDIRSTDTGTVVLSPLPKTVMLQTRFTVRLLEWGIPWKQDIPLQAAELLPPLTLPIAGQTEIPFPLPSEKSTDGNMEYQPHVTIFRNPSVSADKNVMEFGADIDFRKK